MNRAKLARELEAKRAELKSFFDSFKNAEGEYDIPTDQVEELEKRNSEVSELQTKLNQLKSIEAIESDNAKALAELNGVKRLPINKSEAATKAIGELVTKNLNLKAMNSPVMFDDYDVKTLMSTGAGWAPFSPRSNEVALSPQRALTLLDVIPQMDWPFASFKFMEETTFTNSADDIAESVQGTLSAYPESALAFTERTVDARKVATFIPVSDEQLEDVPALEAYLNARLGYMVRAKFEGQLIAGDGNAPNVTGILNVSGIGTQALGGDSVPDAVYKAITKVRVDGQTEPTHILMHPNDFQAVRILQATTGQYLWDNMTVPGATTFFGLPVILSTAVTENTAIVLDMSHVAAVIRRGVEVQVGYIGDDFKNGVKSIRADIRGNLACFRPKAICKVTGI